MKRVALLPIGFILTFGVGCSTTGNFKVPDNTNLYIYEREQPVVVRKDGRVTTRPFFWTAAGGISYRLEKDGSTIQEGRLPSKFRVASIFWPPFALIYWPMGFRSDMTYDLVKQTDGKGKSAADKTQPSVPGDASNTPKRP